jgi:hypothetical protein
MYKEKKSPRVCSAYIACRLFVVFFFLYGIYTAFSILKVRVSGGYLRGKYDSLLHPTTNEAMQQAAVEPGLEILNVL